MWEELTLLMNSVVCIINSYQMDLALSSSCFCFRHLTPTGIVIDSIAYSVEKCLVLGMLWQYVVTDFFFLPFHLLCSILCCVSVSRLGLFVWYFGWTFRHYSRMQPHRASLNVPRVASLSEDMTGFSEELPQCQRMGIMAAFNCFEDFKVCFGALMDRFNNSMESLDDDDDDNSVCNVGYSWYLANYLDYFWVFLRLKFYSLVEYHFRELMNPSTS